MNRETIATLHEVKQAMLQQQTLALREISARLDGLRSRRDTLTDDMARPDAADTVSGAMMASRYRSYQQHALETLAGKIDTITREYRDAEEGLTETFSEVRAIERLMRR